MPQQINSSSTLWRTTENDSFGGSRDGTSSANASAVIERNPDIGARSDLLAATPNIDASVIQLLKGILNATTLHTPTVQTIAYTIANGQTTSSFVKLTGRVATAFIPSTLLGATLTVRQRLTDGTGAGSTITTNDAIERTIVLDGDAQAVDGESLGFLVGAIGSEIAFVSSTNQTSEQTITLKVLV